MHIRVACWVVYVGRWHALRATASVCIRLSVPDGFHGTCVRAKGIPPTIVTIQNVLITLLDRTNLDHTHTG